MMGAQLVSRVYTSWTHLPDRPFRLLAYMALIAKDTNAAPTYWGGRDSLAEALGYRDMTESTYRVVSRAISQLVEFGAIKRSYIGHANKRSEYLLTLQKGDTTVTHRVTPESPKGGQISPERVTPESGKGDTTVTPRNHEEERGTHQEPISSPEVSVGGATSGEAKADSSQPRRSSDTSRRAAIARARAERRAS